MWFHVRSCYNRKALKSATERQANRLLWFISALNLCVGRLLWRKVTLTELFTVQTCQRGTVLYPLCTSFIYFCNLWVYYLLNKDYSFSWLLLPSLHYCFLTYSLVCKFDKPINHIFIFRETKLGQNKHMI